MTNVVFDATLLTSVMGCPRASDYRFNQLWVSKLGKPNYFETGSLVHIALEHYNKSRILGFNRNDAIEIGIKAFHEYRVPYSEYNKYVLDKDHNGLENTPEESDDKSITSWRWVLKTLEEYFDYYKNDSWTVIGAEEVRSKVIYEDSELRVLWKAKFDEIDDTPYGFISMDHKTMSVNRETQELDNQFMGQCFLLEARNMVVNKIGFQKSLKPEQKFQRAIIPYSTKAISEFANVTVPHYARMYAAYAEAGYWPPNYTHCTSKFKKCAFYEACRTDENIRDEYMKLNFNIGKKWDVMNDD